MDLTQRYREQPRRLRLRIDMDKYLSDEEVLAHAASSFYQIMSQLFHDPSGMYKWKIHYGPNMNYVTRHHIAYVDTLVGSLFNKIKGTMGYACMLDCLTVQLRRDHLSLVYECTANSNGQKIVFHAMMYPERGE